MANVMMPIKQEPSSNFILANLTDAESILSIRDLKHRYDLHESLPQVHHKMASTVPIHQAPQSSGSTHGSGTSESEINSSLSLDVLRGLTEKKGVRMDGQPLRKRGPKPDTKPALTRRQELNRQAQRTHRERKELYIKALEQEVTRLKESFSSVSRDKETLAMENHQLKLLLQQHGINWTGNGGVDEYRSNSNHNPSFASSGSHSGSYAPPSAGFSSPPSSHLMYDSTPSPGAAHGRSLATQQTQNGVDYDQAGIDFVLTLERPCMDHMPFLIERALEPGGDPCGHALMATCPPDAFLNYDGPMSPDRALEIPFGNSVGALKNGQKTWDLDSAGLANLLDLSKRLDLDGEITPVMAFGMMLAHPRFSEFTMSDFAKVTEDLSAKVRCYGFGAVLEEFEVKDAIESCFYTKPGLTY